MLRALLTFTIAIGLTSFAAAAEQSKPVVLKPGDKAPKFEGRTEEDKLWKSADHVGKKILVVYFYPADMTPGCTKQACSYRDALQEIDRDDVEVIGVSGDSVENHQVFKREHKLNFTLLADEDGKIAKAFGVKTGPGGSWDTKKGDEPITLNRKLSASRWTFVIDSEGKIAHKDEKVDATKDAAKVLKVIEKLEAAKS